MVSTTMAVNMSAAHKKSIGPSARDAREPGIMGSVNAKIWAI